MVLLSSLLTTTQADLQRLIECKILEGPHIDYKRDLPIVWNEKAKHDLIADVTAFANAGGGDLIFGIDEDDDGQAARIVPQAMTSMDQEVRRLQDLLLNLAEPRLPGVQVHAISVEVEEQAGYVVVVRVPPSWAGPHRVKTNQHFYAREGLRKRQLDVPEVRSLFLRSERHAQRVRDFRTERLGKLLGGEPPHPLVDGPLLVVHIVPTEASLGLVQIDPVSYQLRQLPIIMHGCATSRLNVDGALAIRRITREGETPAYSQFFRNGFLESVTTLEPRDGYVKAVLPSLKYELALIKLFRDFRSELEFLGINTECLVMISLLRAKEMELGMDRFDFSIEQYQGHFDRDTVVISDVLARSDLSAELALKPAFDLVWQAAGLPYSWNYDAAGQWAWNDGLR